jgi:AraC family transcriptional regulator of adaptative response / DNA-3-methyladenine glycosylase II
VVARAERLADGRIDLAAEPGAVRAALLTCPGIGPWTADYVLMRVCHAPDILLATDLVLARQLVARGISATSAWSPYRSYAALHLWHAFLNPR